MELLAPAGNVECLHAAVAAGADAVYLGLDEFNARRNADNFTLETLGSACEYAHLRGVKIYVTMNVEILPSELDRAIRVVKDAHESGADAFIVQDAGLAAELKRQVPQASLHISTQMNIHNAAGIELAARLGASRVTLARELSLEEIRELVEVASAFGMEVEAFGHGALCVCYSGQCLMSSMIGGRSANRGLCAQACRLPYELHRSDREGALPAPGEHLLSPRDLCTVDMLGDLVSAGVASLKVEGRMKSADYVHEVVSVYREVLDGGMQASESHRARLAEAFSRGFTTAYLTGERGNEIMSYGRPNNRGVFAGRVARVRDGVAEVVPEIELHEGDVLEFWTNRGHFAATLESVRPGKDGAVSVPVDQRTGKGDRVFRVRNAATAFHDDANEPRIPVTGTVSLRIGQPAHISFASAGAYGEAFGGTVEAARTRAVSEQDVRDHVDRLGQTPFKIEELSVDLEEGVGIGFSQLHHLRAEALDSLKAAILQLCRDGSAAGRGPDSGLSEAATSEGGAFGEDCLSERSERVPQPLRRSEERLASACPESGPLPAAEPLQVVAWVTSPSTARAAKRAGADALYVPLLNFKRGQAQQAGVLQEEADQAGYPKQCVMALPAVDHDPVPGTREYASSFDMWDYVREGKTVFADSLAGAIRALEMGANVEIGPHVPVTNAASLQLMADLGISRIWLSPELTLGQIADLARESSVPLGLTVAGAQELMITEHCLLMSQGPCAQTCETCARRRAHHKLVDRKGFDFPVMTDMLGRSHLFNGVELDAVPTLPDLVDIGISAVMVDTTLLDKKAVADAVARVRRAREAALSEHKALSKRPNTTTGHLFRGVS
ncbi:MAG: U32 family peptidase [Coriobacteriaceae bacterium]|nr:U32 family peptidase [Coriobacteriaceae bacterium]